MATQQIEFVAAGGLTLTAALYAAGNDTAAYTASAVVEQTNRTGVYRATFSSVAAGTYQLIAKSGSMTVASWWGFAQDVAQTFTFGELAGSIASNSVLEIADKIWDELMSGHTVNGSYGAHFVRSANQNQNTVAITGSNHIAADIHELQPNVINASHIATNAIDADALATDAVNEIAAAVGGGGGGGLTQADVRAAVGLASANLDAQLAAIDADTNTIISSLSGAAVTVNAPVSGGNYRIDIIRGDTYNDIRKPKLRFTVAKNYTGCTITLTIRHRTSDAVLLTKTGTVDSATLLSVELTGTDTAFSTLPLDEYGLHVFDLQATDGSSNRETIIVGGSAVLLLDQSR